MCFAKLIQGIAWHSEHVNLAFMFFSYPCQNLAQLNVYQRIRGISLCQETGILSTSKPARNTSWSGKFLSNSSSSLAAWMLSSLKLFPGLRVCLLISVQSSLENFSILPPNWKYRVFSRGDQISMPIILQIWSVLLRVNLSKINFCDAMFPSDFRC